MGRRRTRVRTFTFAENGVEIENCSDFQVLDDNVLQGRAIIFFDSAGQADHAIVHTTFQDRFYNSTDTSKEIRGTAHGISYLELPGDLDVNAPDAGLQAFLAGLQIWSAGQYLISVVPGHGLVYMDVGRINFDEHGNDVVFEGGYHPFVVPDSRLSEREEALQVQLCEVLRDP